MNDEHEPVEVSEPPVADEALDAPPSEGGVAPDLHVESPAAREREGEPVVRPRPGVRLGFVLCLTFSVP